MQKKFKKSKDRVTLMACANSTGTCKLPLVFIHTSKKPRCFKHMDMKLLPVYYYNQKKAWMNSHIFETWFHDKFVPYVKSFVSITKLNIKYYSYLTMHQHTPLLKYCSLKMGKLSPCFCLQIQHQSSSQWIKEFWKQLRDYTKNLSYDTLFWKMKQIQCLSRHFEKINNKGGCILECPSLG